MAEPGRVRQVGGEMYSWTDWDPERGPRIPGGTALLRLMSELATGRSAVLVAGPHDPALLRALIRTGAAVSCLVRAVPDAERIAAEFPDVTVWCGVVSKVDHGGPFDLIIAADGLDRLASTEGDQQSPDDLLHGLAGLLAPRGVLALTHPNLLGLQHLVELEPGRQYRSDTAWYPVSEHDDLRPASLAELRARMRAHGLEPAWGYGAFPAAHRPDVLVADRVTGDTGSPLRAPLAAALFAALTDAYAGTAVLQDPRPLLERALRVGAVATLAPRWLVLAHPADAEGVAVPRHDLVVGHEDGYVYEIAATDRRLRLSVLAPATAGRQRGALRGVADPGPVADLAPGRVFEEQLLGLCARHDLVGLRAALAGYVSWVQDHAVDGRVSGPVALAGTYDLVATDAGFWPMPARWEPIDAVPVDVVVARALWGFAARLITMNRPHPWDLTASAAELTVGLAATAGRTLRDGDLDAALDLEAAVRAAEEDLTPGEAAERRAALAEVRTETAGVDLRGYRELADARWREEYDVTHLRELMEWTEQTIRGRDRALSLLDQEMQLYRGTKTARLVQFIKIAYRRARYDLNELSSKVRRTRGRPAE
ncbi:hypothetical protein ACFFWC_14330 [Plantactinospora siamensis]|uniref:Class I SAM-dependent methyltransferase n=1 Tax=Plantactinospora siamensis TaxID=555372 RepID=A0ABV6P165_9ACTN